MVIPMCRSVTAMSNTIKSARSSEMVREALNSGMPLSPMMRHTANKHSDLLSKALDPAIHTNIALSKPLVGDCVIALCNYMDKIMLLHPPILPVAAVSGNEEESQDSMDMGIDWDRMELIIVSPLRMCSRMILTFCSRSAKVLWAISVPYSEITSKRERNKCQRSWTT